VLISDNGKGFETEKLNTNSEKQGFGLRGIKERLKLFKGEFEINSVRGSGTEVKVSVPF